MTNGGHHPKPENPKEKATETKGNEQKLESKATGASERSSEGKQQASTSGT